MAMVTRERAKEILDELREFHRSENWLKPDAPSWDEMHVREQTGMTLGEFEKAIAKDGHASFEDFFIASLIDNAKS